MRMDSNQHLEDANLIEVAYAAHQRVIELIMLFQDRLDKTKESILNDQKKNLDEHRANIKELEDISRRMLEMATSSKASLDNINRLSEKIVELERVIKEGVGTEKSELLTLLKELKPIAETIAEKHKEKSTIIQRIVYAILGISVFINFINVLINMGVIPAPWRH